MKTVFSYETPLGKISIAEEDNAVSDVCFEAVPEAAVAETPLIRLTWHQIDSYFHGGLKLFDLPLKPAETSFQEAVRRAILAVPYGETRTYREIAARVGNIRAARAAGNAAGKNPLAIIVPCHRIIGSDGGLRGYAWGLDRKKALLSMEYGNSTR